MPTDQMTEIHAHHSDELSSELSPRQPEDAARETDITAASSEPAAPAKPKKKRAPRPTFEDGSLTRVFKFPSKKYPKSSYYVTDTEIIIRIRKARKKWKLILPKKRVVSCRTNRWFTKPRWIEIELTYTQAVRQGLHEPTPQPAHELAGADKGDAATSLPVEAPAALPPVLADEGVFTFPQASATAAPGAAVSHVDIDADLEGEGEPDDDVVTGWVPDDDADPSMSEEDDTDTDDEALPEDRGGEAVDLSSSAFGTSMDETDEAAHQALAGVQQSEPVAADPAGASLDLKADASTGLVQYGNVIVTTPEAAFEAPAEITLATMFDRPVAAPIATLPGVTPADASEPIEGAQTVASANRDEAPLPLPIPIRVPPKRRFAQAQLLAATLAVVILSMSADWSQKADSTAGNGSCAHAPESSCPDLAIVTGSIGGGEAPHPVVTESPVVTPPEPQPAELQIPAGPTLATPPPEAATNVAGKPALDLSQTAPFAEASVTVHPPPSEVLDADVVVALNTEARESAPASPVTAEPAKAPAAVPPPLQSSRTADIDLCPVRAHSIAKSKVIQFGFASATLPRLGMAPLDALASTLRQCPALQVTIEGHTDSDGDYYRNQSLSVRRALAVREHLVSAGASAAQLSIIGFGQIRPLAPNDTASNKSRNRRIELVVQ